jgi:hypothetical protein
MSKKEVLGSSFIDVMRMVEEYNDMNSAKNDKDTNNLGSSDGSIDPRVANIPGVKFI